ncbi:hypothetical protein H3U94_10720 [Bartonella sp. W8125]|uniref:hypothetical protein n=1 Tax=Bartonella TaxID=773 RepID=UPI0018DD22DB|nr:hypothetical protein [Bartonella choladocola]MBI0141341.1 hypothetical protein [Bartonella choladocola]
MIADGSATVFQAVQAGCCDGGAGKTAQLEHNSTREIETSTIKRCARKEASKTKGKARGKKEGKQKEMGGKDGRKTREEARKRTKQKNKLNEKDLSKSKWSACKSRK